MPGPRTLGVLVPNSAATRRTRRTFYHPIYSRNCMFSPEAVIYIRTPTRYFISLASLYQEDSSKYEMAAPKSAMGWYSTLPYEHYTATENVQNLFERSIGMIRRTFRIMTDMLSKEYRSAYVIAWDIDRQHLAKVYSSLPIVVRRDLPVAMGWRTSGRAFSFTYQ